MAAHDDLSEACFVCELVVVKNKTVLVDKPLYLLCVATNLAAIVDCTHLIVSGLLCSSVFALCTLCGTLEGIVY